MRCPYCQTENRDDRERCYNCDRDLSMLRLVVNKARYHYDQALEHAERRRYDEAIDELHNAIDLDRSFIPAHVVLGTIYAKKGEFDKARECWETALSLQPELHKAHKYLNRGEQVATCLPVLRTLRLVTTGLAIACVILLALFFWARRPDRGLALLKQAYTAYEKGAYGEGLALLDKLVVTTDPESPSTLAATALRDAIRSGIQQKILVAQDLKYRGDYPAALALIGEIEALKPDPETSAALAMLKRDINHYYRDRILDLYNQFLTGEVSYPDLEKKVGEYLRHYPDIPDRDELRKFLDDAREYEVAQQIENIRKQFREDHDTTATIQAMQKLAASYPGTETMKKMRPELVDEILSWHFNEFQSLLDNRDFAAARQLLAFIGDMASEFRDVVDVSGPLKLAERVLAANERTDRLRAIEKLISAERFEEAEKALQEVKASDKLTTAEMGLVMALQEKLAAQQLRGQITQLKARKNTILAQKISDEEATKTLSLVERVLKAPSSSVPADERITVLACGVAAAVKVGQADVAKRYFDMIPRKKETESLIKQLERLVAPKMPPTSAPRRPAAASRSR